MNIFNHCSMNNNIFDMNKITLDVLSPHERTGDFFTGKLSFSCFCDILQELCQDIERSLCGTCAVKNTFPSFNS